MSLVGTASVIEPATQLALLVAGHRGDEGVEADLDLGDLAVEPRILDRGALDRDQAVVERVAGGLALVDRGDEGGARPRRLASSASSSRSPFQKASSTIL